MQIEGDKPPFQMSGEWDAPREAHILGRAIADMVADDLEADERQTQMLRVQMFSMVESLYGEKVLSLMLPNDRRAIDLMETVGTHLLTHGKVAGAWWYDDNGERIDFPPKGQND